METNDLKLRLDEAVERINRPEFIANDPVQFPHRFSSQADIEIAALLTSHIAWGNRRMICRDCERLLNMLENEPAKFISEGDFSKIDTEANVHRTFFGRDLLYFIRGLHSIYSRHSTLEEYAASIGIQHCELPSWELVKQMNNEFETANSGLHQSIRCLPGNLESTPLKRVNMALRWLVRNDGIVDMGIWKVLKPSQLFIPLDVHVANTSRSLGLLTRRSNDRKAVVELTSRLRQMNPDDPTIYDFALFGLGIGE